METEGLTALQLTSLTTASEQYQRRKETIFQLYAQIVDLVTSLQGLEETILEAEETKDRILKKINQISKFYRASIYCFNYANCYVYHM